MPVAWFCLQPQRSKTFLFTAKGPRPIGGFRILLQVPCTLKNALPLLFRPFRIRKFSSPIVVKLRSVSFEPAASWASPPSLSIQTPIAPRLHVLDADEAYRLGPAPAPESYLRGDLILEIAQPHRRRSDPSRLRLPLGERRLRRRPASRRVSSSSARPPPPCASSAPRLNARQAADEAGIPRTPGCVTRPGLYRRGKRCRRRASAIPSCSRPPPGAAAKACAPSTALMQISLPLIRLSQQRGGPRLRLRRRLPRKTHQNAPPHRDPGPRRRARPLRLSRRARVLRPAPPPEGHRRSAVCRHRATSLRRRMGEAAVRLALSAGYTNAGTIEFLVDDKLQLLFSSR
jgi:acetyl-CoA carboxylase biotin carboxylase subunit